MESSIKQLLEDAIKNINTMADVNTVIGEPMSLPNGVTIVPFSRVSIGFATGGADRKPKEQVPLFAGGSGAGVSVTPLGFLVIDAQGRTTLMDLKNPDSYRQKDNPVETFFNGTNSLIDRAPELLNKCKEIFSKDESKDQTAEKGKEE